MDFTVQTSVDREFFVYGGDGGVGERSGTLHVYDVRERSRGVPLASTANA